MVCGHTDGDSFTLRAQNLEFRAGQMFPVYPRAALLPLLPANQRPTHAHATTTGAIAIQTVLDEPTVSASLLGARHTGQLPAMLAALHVELSDEERRALKSFIAGSDGPRGDLHAL